MSPVLHVVTSPLTLLVKEEVAGHALDRPLSTDGLALSLALVVDLVGALILLHKLHIVFLSVKSDELELTNIVLSSALHLVALNLELLKSHLVL